MVDKHPVPEGVTDPVAFLLGPVAPKKSHGPHMLSGSEPRLEEAATIVDRPWHNQAVITEHADIFALCAAESEVHEVPPGAPLDRSSLPFPAIVLDDGNDVLLLQQPRQRPVGRAAIDDDDLGGEMAGNQFRADTFNRAPEELFPIIGANDDGNVFL